MASTLPLNVLTATAKDVANLLDSHTVTSEEVVRIYLAQIERHNKQGLKLRAIISASESGALKQAARLDEERQNGKLRGPFHGVPIILKDCIQTSAELDMPTTGGAAVFKHAIARNDAEIVTRLRDRGFIILGKASLTEYCGNRASNMTTGYNAVNGLTQSAWIEGGYRDDDIFYGRSAAGGSSSGSAVGVAAGFAPLAIATETGGSCCMPTNRAGLYSLKLSPELDLMKGVLPLCQNYDGLGGIARSALDIEILVQAMAGTRDITARAMDWTQIRVGFVDPPKYHIVPASETERDESHHQIMKDYENAVTLLRDLGAKVEYPVNLVELSKLQHKGNDVLRPTSKVDVREKWPEWMAGLDGTSAKTLKDIIDWNEAHPELGMPEPFANQKDLYDDLNSTLTRTDVDEIGAVCQPQAASSIEKCLDDYGIDVIIGPGDCSICVVASIARAPSAMVPMSILTGEKGMGQPQGLMLISKRHGEGKLLEFMKLWEAHHGPWQTATRLRTLK